MSASETFKNLLDLSNISKSNSKNLDIVQRAVQVLENGMGYEFLAVLVAAEPSGIMKPLALSKQGKDKSFLETDKSYVESKCKSSPMSLTNWVVKTSQCIRVGNVNDDLRYLGIRDDILSELCVPLIAGKEVLGVINTETTFPNAYKVEDQKFLEKAAKQIAQMVNQHRLNKYSPALHKSPMEEIQSTTVCAWCNKFKIYENNWVSLENYPFNYSIRKLTHGICPICFKHVLGKDVN